MATFELTLNGYDASVSNTDHLIKWVAGDQLLIERWLNRYCLNKVVKEIRHLDNNKTFEDGLDVLISPVMPQLGMSCMVKNDGDLFQITKSDFDPKLWILESKEITGE